MVPASRQARKPPHLPAGCDGYLTRRQAARALGFSSEFKIRQFERDGVLRSVRGPMRTAFYPRAEILALKARLAAGETGPIPDSAWTDAELLALLGHPKPSGQPRTALDLVLETQISIERAERICAFRSKSESPQPPTAIAAPQGTATSHEAQVEEKEEEIERRSAARLSREALIRELRSPDPRVRERAFVRLQEGRLDGGPR